MNEKVVRSVAAALLMAGSAAAGAASEAVNEALVLMSQGQYGQALQRLESHLQSSPQDAEARFTRGLALVRLDRTDDAIQSFADLTRDYPQLPEPYNNLAVLYAQQGDYDKARDALEAALASHPSYTIAHENLGDIYAALASSAYHRALTLDPGNEPVRAKLELLNQLDGLADSGATVKARPPQVAAAEPAPAEPATLGASASDAIRRLVTDWAAAWSARDIEKYLSFYAESFAPEDGRSRPAWVELRRPRVTNPTRISVQVSDLQIEAQGEERAQAVFRQDYESNLLVNRATKVLELKNVDGNWRIVREYTR